MDAVNECISGIYDSKIAEAEITFDNEEGSIQLIVRNQVLNPYVETKETGGLTAMFESDMNLDERTP